MRKLSYLMTITKIRVTAIKCLERHEMVTYTHSSCFLCSQFGLDS